MSKVNSRCQGHLCDVLPCYAEGVGMGPRELGLVRFSQLHFQQQHRYCLCNFNKQHSWVEVNTTLRLFNVKRVRKRNTSPPLYSSFIQRNGKF